jgi:hypothetical protein
MKRPPATKYSTWLQLASYGKPAKYLMVTEVWHKDGEVTKITLLNLDGSLETKEFTAQEMQNFIDKRTIIEQRIIPPNQDKKI